MEQPLTHASFEQTVYFVSCDKFNFSVTIKMEKKLTSKFISLISNIFNFKKNKQFALFKPTSHNQNNKVENVFYFEKWELLKRKIAVMK